MSNFETPSNLGFKRKIIAPIEGWKPNTLYIVDVAFSACNVIHSALFFSGFLNDVGEPGNYNGFLGLAEKTELHEAYWMEVKKTLPEAYQIWNKRIR